MAFQTFELSRPLLIPEIPPEQIVATEQTDSIVSYLAAIKARYVLRPHFEVFSIMAAASQDQDGLTIGDPVCERGQLLYYAGEMLAIEAVALSCGEEMVGELESEFIATAEDLDLETQQDLVVARMYKVAVTDAALGVRRLSPEHRVYLRQFLFELEIEPYEDDELEAALIDQEQGMFYCGFTVVMMKLDAIEQREILIEDMAILREAQNNDFETRVNELTVALEKFLADD